MAHRIERSCTTLARRGSPDAKGDPQRQVGDPVGKLPDRSLTALELIISRAVRNVWEKVKEASLLYGMQRRGPFRQMKALLGGGVKSCTQILTACQEELISAFPVSWLIPTRRAAGSSQIRRACPVQTTRRAQWSLSLRVVCMEVLKRNSQRLSTSGPLRLQGRTR